MAQSITNFTTAGGSTWTCPAGVFSIWLDGWGGGGYGDSGSSSRSKNGGGGGAYAGKTLAVTPGTIYSFQVGGGASANKDTWFSSTTVFKAQGAQIGSANAVNQGGSVAGSVGDIVYAGGNGGAGNATGSGTSTAGGGGGGAGSPAGAGFAGANAGGTYTPGGAGGGSPSGALGGARGQTNVTASSGQSNANGGAGGGGAASFTGAAGGTTNGGQGGSPGGGSGGGRNSNNGAPGALRITYEIPTFATITIPLSSSLNVTSNAGSYATARAGTGVLYSSEFGWVGQYTDGASFDVNEVFLAFDTSALNGTFVSGKLKLPIAESYGSVAIEARAHDWVDASSFAPGTALAAKTQYGTATVNDGFAGVLEIPVTGITKSAALKIVLASAPTRLGTAPTGDSTTRVAEGATLEVTYVKKPWTPAELGADRKVDVPSTSVGSNGVEGYSIYGMTNTGSLGGTFGTIGGGGFFRSSTSPSALNGRPVIDLSLGATGFRSNTGYTLGARTTFAVVKRTGSPNAQPGSGATASEGVIASQRLTSSAGKAYATGATTANTIRTTDNTGVQRATTQSSTLNVWQIVMTTWAADGSLAVRVNGADVGGSASGLATPTLSTPTYFFGQNVDGFDTYVTDCFLGHFAHFGTYGPLSAVDQLRLEGYLADFYGLRAALPNDHPYKAASPFVGEEPAIAPVDPDPGRKAPRGTFIQ